MAAIPTTQLTTDAYAVIGSAQDRTVNGYAQIVFSLTNTGLKSLAWKVEQSTAGSTYTTEQAEATLLAGETATFSTSPPTYRYYRVQVKSSATSNPTTAQLTTYAHDYTATGTFHGVTVLDTDVETAERMIDRICNDHFASTLQTVYLNGNGLRSIMLTEATPLKLLSLTSLTVLNQSGNTTYTPTVATELIIDPYGRMITFDPDSSTVSGFYRGVKNITVVGIFGWSAPPDLITLAARRLAATYQDGGTLEQLTGTFISERIGDYSYQRGDTPGLPDGQSTGDPTVDRWLASYVNAVGSIGHTVGNFGQTLPTFTQSRLDSVVTI